MQIEIIRQETEVERQRWLFYFEASSSPTLRLNYYSRETRQSKRHRNYTGDYYAMHEPRNSKIRVGDVPIPDDVVQECKGKILEQFRVIR